jgi:hypothetical protein
MTTFCFGVYILHGSEPIDNCGYFSYKKITYIGKLLAEPTTLQPTVFENNPPPPPGRSVKKSKECAGLWIFEYCFSFREDLTVIFLLPSRESIVSLSELLLPNATLLYHS